MMHAYSIRALLRQTGLVPFVAGILAREEWGAVWGEKHGGGDRP